MDSVLIVDDEVTIRKLLRQKLTREGYQSEEADTAEGALNKLADWPADAVMLDVTMPGKSGIELLPEIKARYPDVAVIMATAVTDTAVAIQCIRQGADDYVLKPFNLEEVSLSLKRALEKTHLQQKVKQYRLSLENKVDELRIAVKNADAANRAKSDFLARMSHEIRTPIHGVMGMLDLLRDSKLNEEQSQYINMARTSAETLLSVVNDILDFSKIEAGKIEIEEKRFDLRGALTEALTGVAVPASKKGLELLSQVSRDMPVTLTGDDGRLRQVLVNLWETASSLQSMAKYSCRQVSKETTKTRLSFISA